MIILSKIADFVCLSHRKEYQFLQKCVIRIVIAAMSIVTDG